jgi:hypothetical protein
MPLGVVTEHARVSTFEEAITWLDVRNPNANGRSGRLFGEVTPEQAEILVETGERFYSLIS